MFGVSIKRIIATLVVAMLVGLVGLGAWFGHRMFAGFRAAEEGAEYPPAEEGKWLADQLRHKFGFDAFSADSVERAWANGFQDHTWLFRASVAPDVFDGLRKAVRAAKTLPLVSVDDTDDLSVCPFGFCTFHPQGPSRMRIPAWWDVARLSGIDCLNYQDAQGGYWFGYEPSGHTLYVLVYNL